MILSPFQSTVGSRTTADPVLRQGTLTALQFGCRPCDIWSAWRLGYPDGLMFFGKKNRRRQPGPARLAFRGKGGHFLGKKAAGGSLGLQGWLLEETFYRNARDTLLQKPFIETFGISYYRNIIQKRSGYLIIESQGRRPCASAFRTPPYCSFAEFMDSLM